jgi:MFS family permease
MSEASVARFESNILKYYVRVAVAGLRFIAPIRILYFQSFGLTYAQIGTMELAAALVILVLEIPTGVFADLLGRKTSLVVAELLSFVAFLVMSLGNGFGAFVIGWSISGAADAFQSGASDALLYDSLKRLGREQDYMKVNGTLRMIYAIAIIAGSIAGAYLFQSNRRLPWLLYTGCIGIGAMLCWSLREPYAVTRTYNARSQLEHLKRSIATAYHHRTVRWMILFFLVLSLPMFAFSTLMNQPYLLSRGFSVTTLGFAFGLIHGLSGTLSAFSHVLERRLGERGSFVLISVLYTALFILAGLMLGKAAIGLVVLLYIISNYHGVIVNTLGSLIFRAVPRECKVSYRGLVRDPTGRVSSAAGRKVA